MRSKSSGQLARATAQPCQLAWRGLEAIERALQGAAAAEGEAAAAGSNDNAAQLLRVIAAAAAEFPADRVCTGAGCCFPVPSQHLQLAVCLMAAEAILTY